MVLHVVNGLYIICLSGGITLIILAFFAAQRLASTSIRSFAIVYIAATLLLVIELVKTYEDALKIDIGMVDNVFFAAASFAANALLCWFMFRVVHGVVGTKPSKARVTAYGVISLLLGALGAAKEVVLTFILWNVDYAALLGLHAYCAVLLYRGLKSIEPPLVRSLIRTLLIYLAIFAPLAVAQLVLQDIPSSPPAVHDWPLEELLYYLGFVIIAVVYLARYFLNRARNTPLYSKAGFWSVSESRNGKRTSSR